MTASSVEPVSAASIVVRYTSLIVAISARACSGTGPAAVGTGPARPTSDGTSTNINQSGLEGLWGACVVYVAPVASAR